MTTWKTNAVVLDLSHHNNTLDLRLCKGNVDLVVGKCGEMVPGALESYQYDQYFHIWAQQCQDLGIPFAAYMYMSPDYYIVNQLAGGLGAYKAMTRAQNLEYQLALKWLKGKNVKAFVMDAEKQFINATPAQGVIPSNWIYTNLSLMAQHIKEGVKAGEFPDVPKILYSRKSYGEGYCMLQGMNLLEDRFIKENPDWYLWPAGYIAPAVLTTWDKIRTYFPLDTYAPASMGRDPLFWQFSADGNIKPITWYLNGVGQYGNVDLSCSTMTKDELYKLLKVGTPTPPPPVDVTCPAGQHKDANGVCVPDVAIPPVLPAPGEVVDIAARARLDKLEAWKTGLFK